MSILDEAILEANQIKEAAKRQAEQDILDSHASELNQKIEKILKENFFKDDIREADDEEEEDPFGGFGDDLGDLGGGEGDDLGALGDLGGDPGGGGDGFSDDVEFVDDSDVSGMDAQIPYAFSSGEKMCPCPEEDEEIEIDFDELVNMADNEMGAAGGPMDREDAFGDLTGPDDDDLEGDEINLREEDKEYDIMDDWDDDDDWGSIQEDDDEDLYESDDEDVDLLGMDFSDVYDDEDDEVNEEIETSIDGQRSGWNPRPDKDLEDSVNQDLLKAKYGKDKRKDIHGSLHDETPDEDEDDKEDHYKHLYESQNKKVKLLFENKNKLAKKNVFLEEKIDRYTMMLKESVRVSEMLVLENTSLKYQKKVLVNPSLNERQKKKIVEAITKAKTVEEIERVYKLLDAVPSTSKKSQVEKMNALQEAMKNRPRNLKTISHQKQSEDSVIDAKTSESWKKIVGIKK